MMPEGEFSKIYGNTIRNRVLECFLEVQGMDMPVHYFMEEVGCSKPKTYEVIKELEKQKLIKKSRVVGGTQLYKLNEESKHVKVILRTFDDIIQMIAGEYTEKSPTPIRKASTKAIPAKRS